MHPEDIARVEESLQRSIATGERYDCDYRITTNIGAVVWVQAQGLVLRREGHPARMIGAIVDVSQIKQADAAARSSERRFRVMADGVLAIIWVTSAWGEIEFVENQGPFHARARVRHVSGEWSWIESSAAPRFSESGAFLGHVGMSPDVTSMVEAPLELQEVDRRKDVSRAALSHELRNPLAPILNVANILASPNLRPEQLQWAQRVVQRQAERMAALLDDLLELASIAEGKLNSSGDAFRSRASLMRRSKQRARSSSVKVNTSP